MEDTTTAHALGLPFGRLLGPGEMNIMSSDPWMDLLYPHHEREFFYEKPDADLFFPISSRYLRGWYQVKPWPHAPPPIIHPSYAQLEPITGADIPIEVVQRVVQTLSVDGSSRYEPVAHKRELAACALMCRDWTPVCQAKIFHRITLRCAKDVNQLLDFLRDPTSHIREYILDLRIPPQKLSAMPWIHHLATLYPYLPHLPREIHGYRNLDKPIVLSLDGPLPRGRGPMRSIHQSLPRTPPAFSNHIEKLRLSKLHFRRFSDLADLVGEMPHLYYLDCDNLTIDGSLPQPPAALGALPEITMHNCSFNWASIWLYRNRRRGFSPWQEKLRPDDNVRIGELARIISSGFEGLHAVPTSKSSLIDKNPQVSCLNHHAIKTTFSVSSSQSIALAIMAKDKMSLATRFEEGNVEPPQPNPNSRTLHVYKIQLLLSFGELNEVKNYGFFTGIDWRAFDKTACLFPNLEHVEIDFMTESDFLNFTSQSSHGTALDELFSRNKLTYSIKFGSQPFDWPMGVLTAKVGLQPRYGWIMDQEMVASIRRQLDAVNQQIMQMLHTQILAQRNAELLGSSHCDDTSTDTSLSVHGIDNHDEEADNLDGNESLVEDIEDTSSSSRCLSDPHQETCATPSSSSSSRDKILTNHPKAATSSSYNSDMEDEDEGSDTGIEHGEWDEDQEVLQGGMGGLGDAISQRFGGLQHRFTVNWTDPVLPLVHIG